MLGNTIQQGWLYKQSGLFKQMKETKLVLDGESLIEFDKKGNCKDKFPLSKIQKVERQKSHKDYFGLKISLEDKDYQFFSPDLSTINTWLFSLECANSSPSAGNYEFVLEQFASFKQALQQREEELLNENNILYKEQRAKLEAEIDSFARIEEQIEQSANEQKKSHRGYRRMNCIIPDVPEIGDASPPKFNVNSTWMHGFMEKFINVEFINPNVLTVFRSRVTRALKWRYKGDKADALSFNVSKNILLTSIGFCRPYKASVILQVKKLLILTGKSTNGKLVYKHNEQTNIEFVDGQSVKDITLSSSVYLKKKQNYTVVFVIQGESSYKCVDCYVRREAGITVWEFFGSEFEGSFQSNGSDVACGPIANFQFEILSK